MGVLAGKEVAQSSARGANDSMRIGAENAEGRLGLPRAAFVRIAR
jgi:hypothetical protein